MDLRIQKSLYLTLGALAFLPISCVRADCINGYDQFGDRCGFRFTGAAAFGIALAILACILALLTVLQMRRRKRIQRANLAFIQNSQGQQGSYYGGSVPPYQPNYAANSPNYPNSNYPTTPQTHYPPPSGSPPPLKSDGGSAYDQTHAPPQFPPPTYNA